MGQNLTHGVYLPDEGERNCYNGLAGNWQLLDGAVGTVAEHTTALAGKAPLVHTHTKADITDLLNSNFIPSANNSYDLGSSSYQWNNLYAKNYYYNGTAWGLDKANHWSAEQTYSKNLVITCAATPGAAPSTEMVSGFRMKNAEKSYSFVEVVGRIGTSGVTYANLVATNKFKNGNIDVGGSSKSANLQVGVRANGDRFIYTDCLWRNSLTPYDSNATDLGTSTSKWKSLNGVNPGALSLPNLDSTKYDPIDFSQWNVSLVFGNTYVPQSDGWLYANIKDSPNYSIFVFSSSNPQYAVSAYGNGSQGLDGRVALIMPVRAGVTYTILVKASSTSDIYAVFFMPALGNV